MFRFGTFACILSTSSASLMSSSKPNLAQGIWLDDYPEAKCLDGSPGIYYIRRATSAVNATKWVFHIQGGGWCHSDKDCLSRSKGRLGSSLPEKSKDNATSDLGAIAGCQNNRWCGALMVNDEAINPYSHDWNAVLIRYCDGASFIGNAAEPAVVQDSTLYYRGWHILQAILTDLLAKQDLSKATEVLFGGDSAGGLATFLHIDSVAERLKEAGSTARVLGMPDSGFWPDSEGFAGTFRAMWSMQNGTAGLPRSCVAAHPQNITQCLFPQYFASAIETPLFPLQSLVDPLQKNGPEGGPQEHSDWLLAQLQQTVLAKPTNGGWVHSCERHCGASLLTIEGTQLPLAVQGYLHGGKKKLWLQNEPYPCKACCNDASGTLV